LGIAAVPAVAESRNLLFPGAAPNAEAFVFAHISARALRPSLLLKPKA
jgi:hypothetical protein